jgi:NodT family efflux transporter outer membrane factor (OMF) lipoprotein
LTPRGATPEGWRDYGRATLDFSWEIDFWGKNRAALAAATSEANAALADAAQARITLATSIASSYAELARLHAALDTANAALEVRTKTAELFRQRYQNGLETLGSVRQVESRRASAAADVLALEEQLGLQRNRIAALMGAGPDRGLAIARPTVALAQPFGLPAKLPAELLGRRPDIAAARMRAEAADKRIDQARASFYPNVNLAAFIGVQSLGLGALTKAGSSIGSIGPAISLPIFDGGRLRGNLRVSEAEYAEAVANYDAAVVRALQDVADAVASQKWLGGQLDRTNESVDAARESWRIQNNRYAGGLATYLDVLSAEDSLLSNLRVQSDLQSRAFTLDVALVRALGGGYTTTNH